MHKHEFKTGTLILGDCLDVLADMLADSVDLIVTDPPYRVISGGRKSALGFGWRNSVLKENDGKIFAHNSITTRDYLPAFFRVMRPASHLYLMTNNINLLDALQDAKAAGLHFHNLLIWEKNTATANRWYMKQNEMTLFFCKKPAKRILDAGSKQTFRANNPRNKIHPTEKPVELMQHYVENSSTPGQTVFDPFAGGGATAIAAIRAGRRWIAVEKDEAYFDVAAERIELEEKLHA